MTLRRDTPRPVGRRWHAPVRIAGQALFMVVMGALLVCAVILGIDAASTADEPIVWGTFQETDCEQRAKGGCRSIGTWTSDDGTIRKTNVKLDGWPESDGSVRASYRPHGFLNDDENNIVHVEAFAYGWLWGPWAGVLFIIGVVVYYSRKWWPARRRHRQVASALEPDSYPSSSTPNPATTARSSSR